jgi:excisionase family DNA binding protein
MGESNVRGKAAIIFSYDPEEFLEELRKLIREEFSYAVAVFQSKHENISNRSTENELMKVRELCQFLKVSKPTIYDWIKCGKLRPIKIQSRVYFLRKEIDQLLNS